MTRHHAAEHGSPREHGDEQEPKTVGGHSLAAGAVCIGTAATVALVAIFGQPG